MLIAFPPSCKQAFQTGNKMPFIDISPTHSLKVYEATHKKPFCLLSMLKKDLAWIQWITLRLAKQQDGEALEAELPPSKNHFFVSQCKKTQNFVQL
jgi:hypothetical protein